MIKTVQPLRTLSQSFANVKLYLLLRSGMLGQLYHPLPYSGISTRRSQGTIERWQAIEAFLQDVNPTSVLDVGCNAGYFSLQLAQRGHLCIGVDLSKRAILAANLLKEIYDVRQASFIYFPITPESVHQLPHCRIVICLSIFHHWTLRFGIEQATEMLAAIAGQAQILLFETAQTNNCSEKFRQVLPDMGSDPYAWLESFLYGLNFTRIIRLGEFAVSSENPTRRLLLAGTRQ